MRHHKTIFHYRNPFLFVFLSALFLLFGAGVRAYASEEPDEVVIMQSILLSWEGNQTTVAAGSEDGLFVLCNDELNMGFDSDLQMELEHSEELDYAVSDPEYIYIYLEEPFPGFYLWKIRFLKSPEKDHPQWFEFTAEGTRYHVDVIGGGEPTWSDLSDTLHNMKDGQILRLPRDFKAAPGDSSMLFYSGGGKEITLDLNGHTLDAKETDNGFALALIGNMSLVIMDSSEDESGKITGGSEQAVLYVLGGTLILESGSVSGNMGGGVCVGGTYSTNGHSGGSGTFILNGGSICDNEGLAGGGVLVDDGIFVMNGGSITGNITEKGGGGVYLSSGSFTMAGGSIQNNQAGTYGGGIIVSREAEFIVSGAPVISGNTASGKGNNVYLSGETCISMHEPLDAGTVFSVAAEYSGRTVTEGLPGIGSLSNFRAEESGWIFMEDKGGEAMLGKEARLSYFASEEGTAVMEIQVLQDQEYRLPEPASVDGISIPDGQVFYGWKIGEEFYDPGEKIVLSQASTSIYAVCSDPYWSIQFAAGHENASGSMRYVKVLKGNEYTLPSCGFGVPEGHSFAGWKVGEETKAAGDIISVSEDMTVTALWSVNYYTATFSAGEGTGELDPITELYGTEITLPECPFTPPEGRSFGSWSVEGKNPHYNAGDTFILTGDTVIKPRWVGLWGDLQHRIDEAEDGDVLMLLGDTLAESNDGWLIIPENKDITIDLNGYTLDRNLDKYAIDSIMWVKGSLTIRDSSEAGTGIITGGTDSGLFVDGGSLVLESGTITGNSGEYGGGINVEHGSLIMRGGCVSHNTGPNGAGISLYDGSFQLEGGTICDNAGIIEGYPYDTSGGGVCLEEADFRMTGGIISGNSSAMGGGLYFSSTTVVMSGGEVCDNIAEKSGGGIFLYIGNTMDLTGGTISGNRAESRFGGGIYVDYFFEVNTLNMSGGTVSGNYAKQSSGGIFGNRGDITLSGGTITGNVSGKTDGGLDLKNGNVYLKGSPRIFGNTDKDGESNLCHNKKINIIGELTEEALVGIHRTNDPSEGNPDVFTDGLPGNGTESAFFSDKPIFCVALDSDGEAVLKVPEITFEAGEGSGSMDLVYQFAGTEYELPECGFTAPDGKEFAGWQVNDTTVRKAAGEIIPVEEDITLTAAWTSIPFGPATINMPASVGIIEASAFEGLTEITIVDAHNCTEIGAEAFKGCTSLWEISLDGDCDIDESAFSGCGTIYVFAPGGGRTQAFCEAHAGFVFVDLDS